MAKGNRRRKWYKEGLKTSRKWYKNTWNRKVRHTAQVGNNCEYKKLAGVSAFDGIL